MITDTNRVSNQYTNAGAGLQQAATSLTSQTLNSLQGIFGLGQKKAFQEIEKQETKKQNEYIEKAVIDGTAAVTDNQYVADTLAGDDVYSTAYNKAAKTRAASNIQREMTIRSAEIANQYNHEPDMYRAAMTGMVEGLVTDLELDDEGNMLVSRMAQEAITRYEPQITVNGYNKLKADEKAAFSDGLETTINTGLIDIRNGNAQRLPMLIQDADATFTLGVEQGVFEEEDREKFIVGIQKRAYTQNVTGEVFRSLDGNNFTGAREQLKTWRGNVETTGDMSPEELDRVTFGLMQDINQRESKYKQQVKEYAKQTQENSVLFDSMQRVRNHINAGLALPSDKTNQEAVDDVFMAKLLGVGENSNVSRKQLNDFQDSPQYNQTMIELVNSQEGLNSIVAFTYDTGLIPSQVSNVVKGGVFTKSPEATQQSAQVFQALSKLDPKIIANSFDTETITYFGTYNKLVNAGYTSAEATESANLTVFGMDEPQRALTKSKMNGKEFFEARTQGAKDYANKGWFTVQPDITAPENKAFVADYNIVFNDAYLKSGGDTELATKTANTVTSKKWGKTDINGKDQFMRYSPESVYGGAGDTDWIKETWTHDVNELRKTNNLSEDTNVELISDYDTIQSKTYAVKIVTKDINGLPVTSFLTGDDGQLLRWKPSRTTIQNEEAGLELQKAATKDLLKPQMDNILSGMDY